MIRLIIALVLITTFASCKEKDTIFTKNINNSSSKSITFYFYGNYNPATYGDSITVDAGVQKEISYHKEENSVVEIQQPCYIYNDSVRVVITGGGTLNKRLQEENGWSYSTDVDGNQICTFDITDADIL